MTAPSSQSRAASCLTVYVPIRTGDPGLEPCLDSIRSQDWGGRLTVVIAPNGSGRDIQDRLARWSALREPSFDLKCTETGPAGKSSALNRAEELHPPQGPAIYLDADTRLGPLCLSHMWDTLQPGTGTHLCAPRRACQPPRSFVVRCYWNTWQSLPLTNQQVVFCGVYGVSAEGRQRWRTFPEIGCEDKFVRLQFSPEEQRLLEDARAEIALPRSANQLLRSRIRWAQSNHRMRREFPQLSRGEKGRWSTALSTLARTPERWAEAAVALCLHAVATACALLRPTSDGAHWEHG